MRYAEDARRNREKRQVSQVPRSLVIFVCIFHSESVIAATLSKFFQMKQLRDDAEGSFKWHLQMHGKRQGKSITIFSFPT